MRNHLEDPDLGSIVNRYVIPDRRYRKLLHGNVLRMDHTQRLNFGRALADDARRVTDEDLDQLLTYEWRAQLTAAWLAGFTRRTRHRGRIGELLLASRLCYAGQGFCLALARFGTPEDAQLLTEYLDRYLPQLELRYDQRWALGALLYLDTRLSTDHAERFLGTGGAWQRWVEAGPSLQLDPNDQRHVVDALCSFVDDCGPSQGEPDTPG
jgi:hypothetical protein